MSLDASRLARHTVRLFLATAVLMLRAGHAQMSSNPVHQNTGPLSDLSTNVGAGSRPVHDSGRSVHDGSLGRLGGNSVRGSVSGDVRSGPVSEISAGPVTSGRPVSGGGTMTDASAGAVTKDVDSALGERISQPVEELGPLLQQMRALQPEPIEPAEEAAQEEQAAQDETEAVPEGQAPVAAEEPEDNEEPVAAESDAAAPDEAAAAPESAAAPAEPEEPPPDAEAEPPPDEDTVAPAAVTDDPRDAAEPTPIAGAR